VAAASVDVERRNKWLRVAGRIAKRLSREGTDWTTGLAAALKAGIAFLNKDESGTRLHLENAAESFAAAGMAFHEHAAIRRRGELTNDSTLVAKADEWMASEDIRDPIRFSRIAIPIEMSRG
jgi:hypothetical protein